MDGEELLKILGYKVILRGHKIIREGNCKYKIYLSKEFNDVWEYLREKGKKVDVIVIIRNKSEK